jgi:hypothetical protein
MLQFKVVVFSIIIYLLEVIFMLQFKVVVFSIIIYLLEVILFFNIFEQYLYILLVHYFT